MIRRPPRSTRTDTLFPYTTLFRSVRAVLPGRVREHDPGQLPGLDLLHGRLAVAVPRLGYPAAVGRWLVVAVREGRLLRQLLRLVPRHVPALPLRPDHAAGLEGVHSAEHRVDRGDGADGVLRRVRGRQVMSQLPSWVRGLLLLELFAGLWLPLNSLFKPKWTGRTS